MRNYTKVKMLAVGLSLLACCATFGQATPQNSATVTWTLSPSTNIVSQTIGWGPGKANYSQSMNLAANVNTFQITGLSPGTTYHVAVMCTQSVGSTGTNLVQSAWTPELLVTSYPSEKPASPGPPKLVSQP